MCRNKLLLTLVLIGLITFAFAEVPVQGVTDEVLSAPKIIPHQQKTEIKKIETPSAVKSEIPSVKSESPTYTAPIYFPLPSNSDVILISPTGDGGFENGATFAANGWTVVNNGTNDWYVGTVATYAGTNGAYISNDLGVTNTYTVSTAQVSHFYRDVTFPVGEGGILSFMWRGYGESGYDWLKVFVVPTTTTPVAGTELTGPLVTLNLQAAWTVSGNIAISGVGGTTVRLVFSWRNDGSGGTQPPAAVDNISLFTTRVPSITNYTFSASSGTFTELTGATVPALSGGSVDDGYYNNLPINFDFWYMGTKYTSVHASTNSFLALGVALTTSYASNGLSSTGSTNRPIIAPLWDDNDMASGTFSYKTEGTAGSRVFTAEWKNVEWYYSAVGAVISFQAKFYEGTGVVEFVYRDDAGAPVSPSASIGITAVGSGAGNFLSLDGTGTSPNASSTIETTTLNTEPATGQVYTFTPPSTTPAAPTILPFTGVTQTGMTLNWTDNSGTDEVGFAIYRSVDGINYSLAAVTASDAVSYTATGLIVGTTYYWQIYAINEGRVSSAASGSQATLPPGLVLSIATGLWSNPATWSTGLVPTATDNVVINTGHTVTIDVAAFAWDLTIMPEAVLVFEQLTARVITVGNNVLIMPGTPGGTFQSNPLGTVTTHECRVGNNLQNDGMLDFSTNGNLAGARLTFTGAANATFSGLGPTTDIRTMTINKGTTYAPTLTMNPAVFTVQGSTVDGAWMAFLTITTGTLRISGAFAMTGRVFTAAAYSIPAAGGFWLDNPNFVVAGQNGSPSLYGLFRITQGTFNVGTGAGNSMGMYTGSVTMIEGGAVNVTGRWAVTSSSYVPSYYQSGGVLTVELIAQTSTTYAGFDMGTATTTSFTMTGGSIVIQNASTCSPTITISKYNWRTSSVG
jgi:hypothetical protein